MQRVPEQQEQDRIWSTVDMSEEEMMEQCYQEAWPDVNDLYKYWGVNEEHGMHHGIGMYKHGSNWGQEINVSQILPRGVSMHSHASSLSSNR